MRLTLRLRLMLAFLALVSLILFVGVASLVANQKVRSHVDDLRSSRVLDLRRVDLQRVGLEVEGAWNPSGIFVASDIELTPRLLRPRLRGAIQSLDAAGRELVLYGVTIHVPEDVETIDAEGGELRFESLVVGQRVEVTASVEDGRWEATKIRFRGVKTSDKVKGVVTAMDLDGTPPDTIEIQGLKILVEPSTDGGSSGPLGRVVKATQVILTLQECRAAAHELVGRTLVRPVAAGEPEHGEEPQPDEPAAERLVRGASDFGQLVEESGVSASSAPGAPPTQAYLDWVLPLSTRRPQLDEHVERLRELARRDPSAAAIYLDTRLDPFLVGELLPLVYASLSQAEEDLGDQLREVRDRAAATTRIALATGGVAVLTALVLGFLLWRSIREPLRALHTAARRLGEGHFDTRIEVASRDEFGVLADAFNRMAGQLSTTTVSITNLESVLDSMAAALILFDPQMRITHVNRAALDLLGYSREELLGRPFDLICRSSPGGSPGSSDGSLGPAHPGGPVASSERVFVREDGAEFPVAFSAAELRTEGGPIQGYVCVAQDLSEQKRTEARIRGSLAEKDLLLREVHHRVKNNMQVISSLLAMQSSETSDPGIVEKLEQSQSRIRSMALIHEQLYRSTQLTDIDIRGYLELLTDHIRRSFGSREAVRVVLDVEEIALDIDQSLACGLIVTELLTNSLKHAFPDDRPGVVTIRLSKEASGDCVLSVSDDGRGLGSPDLDRATTLGLSLVRTLARQLRGRVDVVEAAGTQLRIHFPIRALDGSVVS
ncbi:MAG: histidine kinase dimerization/phosphoacceptor domain -containing protein [Planctomycetota bacterium]